jgi:predicted nuclease with TOPRIM domain
MVCHRDDKALGKATRVRSMSGQSVERLMDIILQMKINLAHVTETLHQQTFEIRQELGAVFEEEKRTLERCLSDLDERLEECSACIDDYQRLYANLAVMREKLVQLGADPSVLPASLPSETVTDIISWRFRELKEQGRL